MRFEIQREDAVTTPIIAVSGEIDMATAPLVQSAFDEIPHEQPVVIDLCETSFVDSSGLRLLLMEREKRSGAVHVACLPAGPLTRILEVAGVAGQLPVHATRDAAVAAARLHNAA